MMKIFRIKIHNRSNYETKNILIRYSMNNEGILNNFESL